MLLRDDPGESLGVEGGRRGAIESLQRHRRPVLICYRQADPPLSEVDPEDSPHGAALEAGAALVPGPAGDGLPAAPDEEPGPPIITFKRESNPVIDETHAGQVSIFTSPYGSSRARA